MQFFNFFIAKLPALKLIIMKHPKILTLENLLENLTYFLFVFHDVSFIAPHFENFLDLIYKNISLILKNEGINKLEAQISEKVSSIIRNCENFIIAKKVL